MNTTKKTTSIYIFLVHLIVLLFLPHSLFAQTIDTQSAEYLEQKKIIDDFTNVMNEKLEIFKSETIEISTEPEFPEPNQNIEIELNSSYFDLNKAEIFWYVDGTLHTSGMGLKKINIISGDTGEHTQIRVVADVTKDNKKQRIEKSAEIMPIEMTLLWEADTYTPPFYKGKALLSANSVLKVIATPNIQLKNGKIIDANKLVYIWKKEGRSKLFNDNSGYGKNVLYTEGSLPYRNNVVRVEVSSLDDTIKSSKRIELELSDPSILFYKDDPIKGVMYNEAIKDKFYLTNQELPIKIEPYFFSRKDKKIGNLIYEWYLNGKKTDNHKQKAIFRQESKENKGFSNIKVRVKNIYRKFQQDENSFVLNFN